MSQTILYRIAAVALVVGAVLVTAGNLLGPQGDARAAVESDAPFPGVFDSQGKAVRGQLSPDFFDIEAHFMRVVYSARSHKQVPRGHPLCHRLS